MKGEKDFQINIGVVIPVHNRKTLTIAALANLSATIEKYFRFGQDCLSFKLVVVDDGSTDGTSEWILENRPEIFLVKGDGNLWWSGSVNEGIKYLEGDIDITHIMLWNDDTVCDEFFFLELENAILNDPFLLESILVSKVFWLDKQGILFNFGCFFNESTGKKSMVGFNMPDTFTELIKVDWSGGMGTLIPISVLRELEYFDNAIFPQYHGDADFFLRAKKKGYSTYAVPSLKIYNNPNTTGLVKAKNLKEVSKVLTSNRSLVNFRQNCQFTKRHSNTILGWSRLSLLYLKIFVKAFL